MKNYPFYETDRSDDFRELLGKIEGYYGDSCMFREKETDGIKNTGAAEFKALVENLGAAFLGLGLLDGKIAVIGETSVKWIATYFAAVCGGGVIVPIDKELPDGEIANVINDSGAAAVVYAPSYRGVIQSIAASVPGVQYFIGMAEAEDNGQYLSYDQLAARGAALDKAAWYAREISDKRVSALLYTSGTTGKSKGVMLTQKNVLRAAQGFLAMAAVGKVCLSVLPVHHSYEFAHGIMSMIMSGTTICVSDSPRYFLQNLRLFRPDTLVLVPLYVEMIYRKIWANTKESGTEEQLKALLEKSNEMMERGEDRRRELFKDIIDALGGNLSLMVCGGAPLAAFYSKAFRDFGILLLQGYGITECAPLVSVNRNEYNVDGSVGLPISCCHVKIESEDGAEDGEIRVKGENVMLGYYNNPEATAQVMQDGYFNTGDIGRMDEDGFLHITGRKKNLIVLSNGKNVYPEEIEGYLARIPYIKEAVVYAPLEAGLSEIKLVAEIFVDEAFSKERTKEEVKTRLTQDIAEVNKGLPGYKQIHEFSLRDREFEKTTKKSIKRFAIVHNG